MKLDTNRHAFPTFELVVLSSGQHNMRVQAADTHSAWSQYGARVVVVFFCGCFFAVGAPGGGQRVRE